MNRSSQLSKKQDQMKQKLQNKENGVKPVRRKGKKMPPLFRSPEDQSKLDAEMSLGDIEAKRLKSLYIEHRKQVNTRYYLTKQDRDKLAKKLSEAHNSLYKFIDHILKTRQLLGLDEEEDE